MVNRLLLLVSSVMTKALTVAVAAILVVSNITIIYAQQLTSQSGEIDNGITATPTTFQSASDGFTVQVPDGWIIQDANNTGSRLEDEIRLGYGILAQLCTKEQQGAILPNASDTINSNSTINTNGCQGAQEGLIHIVRYPDLDTRVVSNNITANNMTTDNILLYHLQKLQEVGYRGIQIVNRSDVTLNLTNPQTNQTIATVPAKLVEMTYNTASAPNEMRRGYLISTASNQTAPNLGTTKGYTVFYEGNIITNAVTSETTTATASNSLALTLLPPAVAQVFDSFELLVAPEVAQALAEETAQAAETTEGGGEGDDGDGDDNGGDDGDGDDNGGDDGDGDDNGGDDGDGDDNGGDDGDGDEDEGDNEDGQGLAQRIIEETEERVGRIIGR
jgi:hypothetical protein